MNIGLHEKIAYHTSLLWARDTLKGRKALAYI